MAVMEKNTLERAAFPEEVGVSSRAIADLIEDLVKSDIEAHSIMILRHGKVAFECWRKPFGPDIPHAMYSVSKSFTSTAIGFAIDEGLLTLDTRVLDIFPEYKPAKRDENLENLRVFHLLTMTAGKDVSLISDRSKDRWVEDFFNARWKFAPGESWRYVNENQYMLCVILNRLTGMSVVDYLTPRLFIPLGIDRKPFWETDGNGIEAGGWGLHITTEELAKVTLCYSQGGQFNGKQVIPAFWAQEAVKKQVSNENNSGKDSTVGYGFCFWRNGCPDSYRLDGMFSQFGIVFEKYDAAFIITSCEISEQKTRNCIWRHFPEAFFDEKLSPCKKPDYEGKLELPALPNLPASRHSPLETTVSGKIIKIRKNPVPNMIRMPFSMLIKPAIFMSSIKFGNIEEVRFSFSEKECTMCWREGNYKNTVACGLDGVPRRSPIRIGNMKFTASSTACWREDNTLEVWIRPLETIGERRLTFIFDGEEVKILPDSRPAIQRMMQSFQSEINRVTTNPAAMKAAGLILKNGEKIVEPPCHGKLLQ